MIAHDDNARAELRARQGAGARYDDPAAPHDDLRLARMGTAYFARLLANLNDRELDNCPEDATVSRRQVVARVGLEARLIAEAIASLRTAPSIPLAFELVPTPEELTFTSTLPPQALRNLFAHSEVHLNVEWRDLSADGWSSILQDAAGNQVPVAATPRNRALSLWRQALKLHAGGRQADVPFELGNISA
jgi:maleylpyruvate isomerase